MKTKQLLLMPLVLAALAGWAQTSETDSFTNLNRPIPDGNWAGLSDVHSITSAITQVRGLHVKLQVIGEYNGDLYCYLRHVTPVATNFCILLDRVGRSTALSAGYADAGLDVTFDDSAVNGNIHTYQLVTTPPAGWPLTGVWQPDGRRVDPASVLDTSPVATTLSAFNGADANGEWTLFIADLDSGGTNMLASWELDISGAVTPPITWPTPSDIAYGTALGTEQLNASAGSVSGTFVYDPPSGTVLNAGPHTLQAVFTPTAPLNYLPATNSITINVMAAPLTITANNASKVYGEPDPPFNATYDGFVNNETPAVLGGMLSFNRAPGENAGTYQINPGGLSSMNYTITLNPGTLTIAKANSAGIVSVSQNPAKPGDAVSLSFSLSAVAPGAGTPTGSVQFRIDGATAGLPVSLAGGVGIYTASGLTVGTHEVVAEYPGDENFQGTTNSLSSQLVIDTPPLAGPVTIVRFWTNDVKVSVATLLSNDSDADGDTLTFVGVSATSTNQGTLTQQGGWITYTPPSGSTNDDSFAYMISDGHWLPATGTVYVVVGLDTSPSPNLQLVNLNNGSYVIRFSGIPGLAYQIEYCDDVQTLNWEALGTATADQFGIYEYVDTPPGGLPYGYYRSVFPQSGTSYQAANKDRRLGP